MSFIEILVLALVQGITEFLPVSSSAHLILVPYFTDWPDQSLSFDIAVHVGTLLAVCIYFRDQIADMTINWLQCGFSRKQTQMSILAWMVIIGTLPLVIAGFLGKDFIASHLRSTEVIAWATILFGLALGFAAWFAKRGGFGGISRDEYSIFISAALIIGCAQALALIPGTSRSGITMTAGILLGLQFQAAARFSFLLSIPAILAAGSLLVLDLFSGNVEIAWLDLFLGTALAFISALLCIHWFLKLLDKIGFMPFVVYRFILGVALLIWFT